ncbi:putative hydroxymethylpyrimidine transporter CytX [Clostridium punense]|uniref:Hydroxymethylpyrimidine transporter CytX n=1 Tax=Clostridium punense TaxID=1054297 RepID=A0ABS4K7A4_9CLOT|nr:MULTISPECIES: putative hydroxymethylpyrimidine transporter CytX [Clostridium]EQB86950.1 hypothetical protein M918_11420 [Clostridium sp. BL8]MBP2023650.1 putative hydroxymethylpyrimidine transporter CytX [Clostridium punense]
MKEPELKLSSLSFFTLWFGAAISIAEIFSGGLIAPLGFRKGILAILIGHFLGTIIFVLGGIIGSKEKMSAINSTESSFGVYGRKLFGILNVLQLVGWTAVMIKSAAVSLNAISVELWKFNNIILWAIFIAFLVMLWIWYGNKGIKYINATAVILLLGLMVLVAFITFKNPNELNKTVEGVISFGGAVEISAVMPLSWLPLAADYTRQGTNAKRDAIGSFFGYFLGSSFMYAIGLGASIAIGNSDPGAILLGVNLGIVALGVVTLSTVTTTFLDAYSAGVSFMSITDRFKEKNVALIMTIIGLILALFFPIETYESFLYAIGSVFAPLFSVVLTDYFILKRKSKTLSNIDLLSILHWVLGVILYYTFVKIEFILGATVPVMIIISMIYIANRKIFGLKVSETHKESPMN